MDDSAVHGDDKVTERNAEDSAGGRSPKNTANEGGGDVLNGDNNTGDDEGDGPTSSIGNIIPISKLKNGWFALSTYVTVSGINDLSSFSIINHCSVSDCI